VNAAREYTRDWRVLLLIAVDLLSLFALYPRIARSTTEIVLTDINTSTIVQRVLESSYSDVHHIFSNFSNGLWLHGFSFLPGRVVDPEILQSELKSRLSGMIPRGIPPDVSINGTTAYANITVIDRDCVATFIENNVPGKVVDIESLANGTYLRLDKKVDRSQLEKLLESAARITYYGTPRTLKTNLKLGIDFLGGFYYNVKPVGISFTVQISAANATPRLLSDFLNTSATLKTQGSGGIITIAIQTPPGSSSMLMELALRDFFSLYYPIRRVSFSFGNETSELVVNATNYGCLRGILNQSLSGEYDIVGGDEHSGVFEVEGKGSEATLEELNANLSEYLKILSYESRVSPETMDEIEKMIQSRANFLGVSDLRIKRAGNQYIMVESPERIPGNSSILEPLDFEARLWKNNDESVLAFTAKDVARVDHYYYVSSVQGWAVPLTLRRDAAERMRQLAISIGAASEDEEERKKHPLGMFFNGVEVYNASFAKDLADSIRQTTVVSFLAITGGPRENEEARRRAEELYINLQASFHTKLRTVGEGEIPPVLGRNFGRQVAAAAAAAILAVSVVVFLRYRKPKLVLAIITISLSEVLIILGFAVMIGWYLDISSVAGLIAVIGTGVDHQIVITDEALYQGEGKRRLVISTRISRAFFVIFTAAATTIIAMSPLAYVGLGRLRGFAIVTIVGVLAGVLVTRPAYGRIVRRIVG